SEFRNEAIAAFNLVDLEERPGIEASNENTELNEKFTRFAMGGRDGRIAILNTKTKDVELKLAGFGLPVRGLRFSHDDRYLAADYGRETETEGRFIVWSLVSQSQIIVLQEPISREAMDFSGDGGHLAVGVEGRRVRVYDLASRQIVFESTPEPTPSEHDLVSCLRFDPLGQRLAECSAGSLHVNVWDIAQKVSKSYSHTSPVVSVDWSPDGHQLATACANGDAYLWDLPSNKKERLYRAPAGLTRANLRFNRMGTVLAAICSDLTLRLWRPQSGHQILASIDVQESARLQFSSDDRWLSLTMRDGRVRLFALVGGQELLTFRGEDNSAEVRSVGFDQQGRWLIAAGGAFGIWLWDTEDHRESAHIKLAKTVSVGLDGASLLASTADGFFRVPWNAVARNEKLEIEFSTAQCLDLPLGLDRFALTTNRLGAVIHADKGSDHIHVFHLGKPEENHILAADRELDSIAITPDGSWLAASANQEGTNLIWDLHEANVRAPCRSFPGSRFLTFSPAGRWFVTSWAGKFQFRKVGSWEPSEQLSIPRLQNVERFSPVAFGRLAGLDDCLLAVAISPTRIKLFRFLDRDSPKLDALAELESPDRLPIVSLTFNPACSRLAAGSEGQIVQVWNLASIREELQQRGLASNFPEFSIPSSDNRRLVFKQSQANESERAIQGTRAADWALVEILTQQIDASERSTRSDCFTALIERGRVYLHLKRYELAERDFTKALKLRPDDATAQRSKARVEQLLKLKQAAPGRPEPNTGTTQP
ncbi:MAG: tetratricopeptide repeat protein, partial [Verrucomicrobiota bacterium]